MTDNITLDNYKEMHCPKCQSRLWLQGATAYAPEGVAQTLWVHCITNPKCDFRKTLQPWPWAVEQNQSLVGDPAPLGEALE